MLKQKNEESKNSSSFDFAPKSKLTGNLETIQNEIIYIEEPNLILWGFFTDAQIKTGETLVVYVELSMQFWYIDWH